MIEQREAELQAAMKHRDAALVRVGQLEEIVRKIDEDLGRRRAELPGLAEDASAFTRATAAMSAEEDRRCALADTVIPNAKDEVAAAQTEVQQACDNLLTARAAAAVRKIALADCRTASALEHLSEVLEKSLEARREGSQDIYDALYNKNAQPYSSTIMSTVAVAKVRGGALDETQLGYFMPKSLWAFLRRYFNNHEVTYFGPADARQWYLEKCGVDLGGDLDD